MKLGLHFGAWLALAQGLASCGDDRGFGEKPVATDTGGDGPTSAAASEGAPVDDDGGARLDVADDPGPSVEGCAERAEPGSFEPVTKWEVEFSEAPFSVVTPLVANLTDDDGDGAVTLDDVPDVVVVSYLRSSSLTSELTGGVLHVLDGATGDVHARVAGIDARITPALGDLDADGDVEIVTLSQAGNVTVLDGSGAVEVTGDTWSQPRIGALALADLDADGRAEIIGGAHVWDSAGQELWTTRREYAGTPYIGSATTVADLNEDGEMEVVFGPAAMHADGEPYFVNRKTHGGFPHVVNFDDDPEPEVVLTSWLGVSVLEHTGVTKHLNLTPTGQPGDMPPARRLFLRTVWIRPGAFADFDGDGVTEFAMSSGNKYSVFEPDLSVSWSVIVEGGVIGVPSATAFDFLGDGSAEALHASVRSTMLFDGGTGDLLGDTPRQSKMTLDAPVVADVDNDGAAEVVMVAGENNDGTAERAGFTVKVIEDAQDRWVQARRIWNQHTYHVTNVNEDGSIPMHEEPHWRALNTFRSNAQTGSEGVCPPPVAG